VRGWRLTVRTVVQKIRWWTCTGVHYLGCITILRNLHSRNDYHTGRNMAIFVTHTPSNTAPPSNMTNDVSRDLLAELNNEGAFLLENGRFSSAIEVLTSALNAAMGAVGCSEFLSPDQDDDSCESESAVSRGSSRHNPQHHQSQQSKDEKQSHRSKRNGKLPHVDSTSISVLPTMTEDKLVHSPCNFVCSKPLRVADRYSLPSFVELTLYVVYNLAVAHHLRILKRNHLRIPKRKRKGNTRVLREILRLYKLAHLIQAREEIGLEPTYTLSLWNNMGQSYKSLGKHNKADMCFNNVLSNVVCMIDHGCVDDVDRLSNFLDNIAHILSPFKHYADAA
jgi:hypothetical protein